MRAETETCVRQNVDGGLRIAPLLVAIEDEGVPHWVVTRGWFIADSGTHVKWIAWSDYGVHADAPVTSVWTVVEGR